jgi:hypothetical protein
MISTGKKGAAISFEVDVPAVVHSCRKRQDIPKPAAQARASQ